MAYGTDLERAIELVHEAASGAEGVLSDPPVRVLCSGFADSSVDLDVDFWHLPGETDRRLAKSNVVVAVHRELQAAGITIPFPQRTVWAGQPAVADDTG